MENCSGWQYSNINGRIMMARADYLNQWIETRPLTRSERIIYLVRRLSKWMLEIV